MNTLIASVLRDPNMRSKEKMPVTASESGFAPWNG